jgi:hypothetical protein
MTKPPHYIYWKQEVAGEALPQVHRRRLRPPGARRKPYDWVGLVQIIVISAIGSLLLMIIAFAMGAFGGPR